MRPHRAGREALIQVTQWRRSAHRTVTSSRVHAQRRSGCQGDVRWQHLARRESSTVTKQEGADASATIESSFAPLNESESGPCERAATSDSACVGVTASVTVRTFIDLSSPRVIACPAASTKMFCNTVRDG